MCVWCYVADSESVDIPVSENYFSTPKRFRSTESPNAGLSFNPEVRYQRLELRQVHSLVITPVLLLTILAMLSEVIYVIIVHSLQC